MFFETQCSKQARSSHNTNEFTYLLSVCVCACVCGQSSEKPSSGVSPGHGQSFSLSVCLSVSVCVYQCVMSVSTVHLSATTHDAICAVISSG